MNSVSMNKLSKITVTLLFVLLFAMSVLFYLVFLFVGVADIFGKTADIFTAIDCLIDIFQIGKIAFYKCIFGVALAVLYFVLAVFMLKKIIFSALNLKTISKVWDSNILNETLEIPLVTVLEAFESILFSVILFAACCRMVSAYQLSTLTVAMIIVGVILYLGFRVVFSVLKTNNFKGALYHYLLCSGIFCLSLIVIATCISTVSFSGIIDSLSALGMVFKYYSPSNILAFLFEHLVQPIGFLVIQILALSVVKDVYGYINYSSVQRGKIQTLMTMCIVLAVLCALIAGYRGGSVFDALRPYISIVLCSVVLFWSPRFPKYSSSEEQTSNAEE